MSSKDSDGMLVASEVEHSSREMAPSATLEQEVNSAEEKVTASAVLTVIVSFAPLLRSCEDCPLILTPAGHCVCLHGPYDANQRAWVSGPDHHRGHWRT